MDFKEWIQTNHIKYIATDIDGTIVFSPEARLSDEFLYVVKALMDHGVKFIVSSGRQYANERRLFGYGTEGETGIEPNKLSYVADNGAIVVDEEQVIFKKILPMDLGLEIVEEIKKYKDCSIYISGLTKCYVEAHDEEFVHLIRDEVGYDTDIVGNFAEIAEPIVKVALCAPDGANLVADSFHEKYDDVVKVVTSGNRWIDFVPLGIDKGSAMEMLLKQLGLNPEDGIAFGDQENDIEMLKLVGLGCAVATAKPNAILAADCVVDNVLDCLKQVLEILENKEG